MSRHIVRLPARVVMELWRCDAVVGGLKCWGELKCTSSRRLDYVRYVHTCTHCGRTEEAARSFPAYVPEIVPGAPEIGRVEQ